jgi:hypothetical protein
LLIWEDAKYRELSGPPLYPGHHLSGDDCAVTMAATATPVARAAPAAMYLADQKLL